jgi:hypothetical protein
VENCVLHGAGPAPSRPSRRLNPPTRNETTPARRSCAPDRTENTIARSSGRRHARNGSAETPPRPPELVSGPPDPHRAAHPYRSVDSGSARLPAPSTSIDRTGVNLGSRRSGLRAEKARERTVEHPAVVSARQKYGDMLVERALAREVSRTRFGWRVAYDVALDGEYEREFGGGRSYWPKCVDGGWFCRCWWGRSSRMCSHVLAVKLAKAAAL